MIKDTEKDFTRSIQCSCGQWEEFSSDQPRSDSQTFVHILNYADCNEAMYMCPDCKEFVDSEVI
jgi:hypothetical protein